MDIFTIDTTGDRSNLLTNFTNCTHLQKSNHDVNPNSEEEKRIDFDSMRIYDADYLGIKTEQSKQEKNTHTEDFDLEEFETSMGWKPSKVSEPMKDETRVKKKINPVDEVMKKSVITPDFEKLRFAPPYELSKRQLQVRKQREKRKAGTGEGWFNMRAPYVTPEIKHDLEVLQMRSALDPKQFYKKNDRKALPKHFHIGKIMDSPMDYYSSRLTKKERKKTIVDELMADAEFTKYNKRKHKEIIEEKQKTRYKRTHKKTWKKKEFIHL